MSSTSPSPAPFRAHLPAFGPRRGHLALYKTSVLQVCCVCLSSLSPHAPLAPPRPGWRGVSSLRSIHYGSRSFIFPRVSALRSCVLPSLVSRTTEWLGRLRGWRGRPGLSGVHLECTGAAGASYMSHESPGAAAHCGSEQTRPKLEKHGKHTMWFGTRGQGESVRRGNSGCYGGGLGPSGTRAGLGAASVSSPSLVGVL